MKNISFQRRILLALWSVMAVLCVSNVSAQRYLSVANGGSAPVVESAVAGTPMVETISPEMGIPADGTIQEMVPEYTDGAFFMDEPDGLFLHRWSQPGCVQNGFGPGAWFLEGYLAQGLTCTNSDSEYLEPLGTNDRDGYQMNQLYFSMGRCVAKDRSWALGGRVDLLYGTDYYFATATGLETNHRNVPKLNGTDEEHPNYRASRNEYGLAIPQAYLEMYVPILLGVDVKVGHFYSVMGYESTKTTENFFCSRSYTSLYGMPTTMSGVMTTSRLGDRMTMILGAVNEWNALDTPTDCFSFVGGATFENAFKTFSLSAIVMAGRQGVAGFQPEDYPDEATDTTVFNLCAKWQFAPRLAYVAEFTTGHADNEYYCIETDTMKQGRSWYGFSNYLFFQAREDLSFGFRFEWFNDPDDTVINGGYGTSWNDEGTGYFAWTFGANWNACRWMTIRPELRWDYSDWEYDGVDTPTGTYDENTSHSQFAGSMDFIIRF